MKRHTSRRVFQRHNIVKELIFNLFFMIASRPRLMLEVFIRRKMGRRYFRISSAITVFILLVLFPIAVYSARSYLNFFRGDSYYYEGTFWSRNWAWYLFTALFVLFCVNRARETYPHGNVYDYNYFSLSTGYSLAIFANLPFLKKKPSGYMVEVLIEPGFFFIIGLILSAMGQSLGKLLEFSSICYGFSYAAAYHLTDEKMQDLIDGITEGEEFERSFIHGFEASRGVKNPQRPSDEELRQKMASRMYPPDGDIEDAEFTVL